MAYQVLARKYRPQRFSDVAGQEHVTRTLLNALAQERVAHGYVFSGHRGIGKTTIARILAQALNCRTRIGSPERPSPEPCGICDSCTEIRAGNAVDVIEIDAATNRGIDEIRELRDAARYRPARDRYKIYILDEAHQITDAAFNALLKTLEEPPDHVIFMMATTQPEDIPQTVRSRCQHFSFHAVRYDDILTQLRTIATEENIAAEDAALALLAEAGDGSMRDALSIMDQAIASAPIEDGKPHLDSAQILELMGTVPNTVFERLMEAISENQTVTVIEEVNRLINAGNNPSQLARQFVRYLRNTLMARIAGENSELLQISSDERARAARSALLFSEEDLTRFLQVMLRTFDELNYRQEQRFHLELGLIKLVHLQRLLPLEQLMSQLPAGGASATRSALGGESLPAARAAAPPPARASSQAAPPSPRTPEPPAKAASSPPAFSPFEADRNRKITGAATMPEPRGEVRLPSPLPPVPVIVFDAVKPATATPSTSLAVSDELTGSAVAVADEPPIAMAEEDSTLDLIRARDAICAALEDNGHNTAAALLGDGNWTETGSVIQAEVRLKKTMLSLTMNADAERICRNALRDLGITHKLVVVPGEGAATAAQRTASTDRPRGGVQAEALENPLVRQAQELFGAEVRSVLDLRDK
jgi:DNA polymerase-3 subunit gamma/tau